ncbi:cation:proton antiporter [Jiangella mangrovi]|uniref:Kef-type K+ transport system membrane component KefB n=1 Tax=Jiangella mangrovi TaxID=1524084 RepID=A0A7W9GMY3_9ACTN|nr:Kef-type K+ transport system membrane component KefB [Jiangella mangrovi]
MTSESSVMLTVVLAVAVLAPILADRLSRFVTVPSVVLQIGLGILIGPAVLDWVRATGVVDALSDLGLAFLMLLAGYELEFKRIRGAPLRAAIWAWFASLALGVAAGLLIAGVTAGLVVGLALTTTTLGAILPMLRDRNLVKTEFGTRFLAVGAMGEFLPIVAVAFALSGERPSHTTLVLVLFGAVATTAAALARRPRHPAVARLVTVTLGTSAQVAVRFCVLISVAMVALAESLDLDPVMGAFASGVVIHLFLDTGVPRESDEVLKRLEALGFGFFIPIFFIMSGVRFDVGALGEPATLALLPVFLVLFLAVRGAPTALLQRPALGTRPAVAMGLLAATALPLLVVITRIAQDEGVLSSDLASALVGAGMLSVLIFPAVALRLLGAGGISPERGTPARSPARPDPHPGP